MCRSTIPPGMLAAGALFAVVASGCYVPGGGWTLRSGIDRRTHRKPAMYVEMVDTRWDEWNRTAHFNTLPPQLIASPEYVPGSAGTLLPEGSLPAEPRDPSPVPPPLLTPVPPAGPGPGVEPHPMPGLPEVRELPPPSGPTAQSPAVEKPVRWQNTPAPAATVQQPPISPGQGQEISPIPQTARSPKGGWLFSRP